MDNANESPNFAAGYQLSSDDKIQDSDSVTSNFDRGQAGNKHVDSPLEIAQRQTILHLHGLTRASRSHGAGARPAPKADWTSPTDIISPVS
jgi:hypothetical protein